MCEGEGEIQVPCYGISHRTKGHSIRNVVSDIVIALCGYNW